tara:strand:+ start:409 stop:780 length:372 start_codon:yes stop_codon:yes gene_type:complete
MSRSSVTSLPNTGTITSTPISAGTTTTIAGPTADSGATWKILGITITASGLEPATATINLINSANSNKVILVPETTYSVTAAVEIGKYSAGELLLDDNLRIEIDETDGAADGFTAQVAYVVVN